MSRLPALLLALVLSLLLAAPAGATCPTLTRSAAVVRAFKRTHPCPATGLTTGRCVGYVVDHRWPLCAGGSDTVENLVWQEVQAAQDKDKLERAYCRLLGCQHRRD